MTTAHAANGITSTNITNWNAAYGWGNHAGLYRPITYVPVWGEIISNPFYFSSPANDQLIKFNSSSAKWENWTPNYLTSVTATAPIVSSGGNSPVISISAATTSAAGSMSAADKTKLNGLQAGWNLTGNSGTVDGTNFIGTTDNKPLNFKVNNQNSGRIDTLGTTFIGYKAGMNTVGAGNAGFGYKALSANTTGINNTLCLIIRQQTKM